MKEIPPDLIILDIMMPEMGRVGSFDPAQKCLQDAIFLF